MVKQHPTMDTVMHRMLDTTGLSLLDNLYQSKSLRSNFLWRNKHSENRQINPNNYFTPISITLFNMNLFQYLILYNLPIASCICRPTCYYMGTSSLQSEQGVQLIDTSNHFNKKKKRWLLCTVHKKTPIKSRNDSQIFFVLFPVQVHPRRSSLYSKLLNTSWKHSCTAFIETTHEGTTNHNRHLTLHHPHHHHHLHCYCPWS